MKQTAVSFKRSASRTLGILPLLLGLALASPSRAQEACSDVFGAPRPHSAGAAGLAQAQRGSRFDDPLHFETMAKRIEEKRAELARILSAVDNVHGAEYEITQVVRTLRGIRFHELNDLRKIGSINNVAVYGSTNIPLYTLILHGVIPASTGAHVWFRTPELSREVYVRLFERLSALMPELPLSRIHILTEPKDVQYDNFRKKHVLGLNNKGKRFERPPSEVVIFTGNPRTGKEILDANLAKLEELSPRAIEQGVPLRQIFMKFGSGLNPVVVTAQAAGRLEPALEAAITAIKINSSQDCIAPKLYAVHASASPDYFKGLLAGIQSLKYGPNTHPRADYGPLTFTRDFSKLKAFRAKWENYLINKEALIRESEGRVDPHVFVFPIALLKDVELADHYAPFLVHFEYGSKQELSTLANDPRIRERAMFASIFGQASSTELVQVRKLFEDNFHATVMNQSVFVEESGNFPFGGYSGDASSVTLLQHNGAGMTHYTYDRPLLFSKEAGHFFAGARASRPSPPPDTNLSSAKSREIVSALIRQALDPSPLDPAWKTLKNPVSSPRPRGLNALRKVIQEEGLYVVQWGMNSIDKEKDLLFYGPGTIPIWGSTPGFTPGQGVVLHPSFLGREVQTMNFAQGRINPNMGYGYLHPLLFGSKVNEYHVANSVRPGSMAKSLDYDSLMKSASGHELFAKKRESLRGRIDRILTSGKKPAPAEENALVVEIDFLLQSFFHLVHQQMPEGAFVKNFNETTTGDLGNQITSYSQNTRNYAREFVARLSASISGDGLGLDSPPVYQRLTSSFYETGAKFISKLLTHPSDLLIQQRLRLAKTDLGFPVEVRVDFLDGEAVHARPRYTHEYLRPEMAEAMRSLNSFFKEAPEELRYLSGGADLARLEDGRWVFIEFNFGSNSGTALAELFPIERNMYLSRLQNRMTPLIQKLEGLFAAGPKAQNAYLKSLKVEGELWQKKSIDDLSMAEVARYFRDRSLDEFRRSPTRANGTALLASLREAFEGVGSESNRDLPLLIRGAENFLTRTYMSTDRPGSP